MICKGKIFIGLEQEKNEIGYHLSPKDHKDRDQDLGWHLGGKVKARPYGEGNGLRALRPWGKIGNRVASWSCLSPWDKKKILEDSWSEEEEEEDKFMHKYTWNEKILMLNQG